MKIKIQRLFGTWTVITPTMFYKYIDIDEALGMVRLLQMVNRIDKLKSGDLPKYKYGTN